MANPSENRLTFPNSSQRMDPVNAFSYGTMSFTQMGLLLDDKPRSWEDIFIFYFRSLLCDIAREKHERLVSYSEDLYDLK